MHIKIIYPKWRKLERQTNFNLPPHGPVVFAATLPPYVHVSFIDENVDEVTYDEKPDLLVLSIMLSAQLLRGIEIAKEFQKMGVPVLVGGISASLHSEELMTHVDSVFTGEAEGRMEEVLNDLRKGKLAKLYNF